jgi:ribose-phosphate pyrophosphokinase
MRVILASQSPLKVSSVRKFFPDAETIAVSIGVEQPIDTTVECAFKRIDKILETPRVCDFVIAIESGIESQHDVAMLAVHNMVDGSRYYFGSFGIRLDDELYARYLSAVYSKDPQITFGQYLRSSDPSIDSANWMRDPRFLGICRTEMFDNVLNQFYFSVNVRQVKDFPKKGILYEDLGTTLSLNPVFSRKFDDFMYQFINFHFDQDTFDQVVGLQSRGYIYGAKVAGHFLKMFLPLPKLSKLPVNEGETVVIEEYSTEYDVSRIGLVKMDEFVGRKCLVVDDVYATGGTINASTKLLSRCDFDIRGTFTLVDIPPLRNNTGNISLIRKFTPDQKFTIQTVRQMKHYSDVSEYYANHLQPTHSRKSLDVSVARTVEEWMSDMSEHCTNCCANHPASVIQTKPLVISTARSAEYGQSIAGKLRTQYIDSIISKFPNGETRVQINQNIRNRNIAIVCQTTVGNVNDDFTEMLLIIDACQRSNVGDITVVLPYYPYARGDKKDAPRVPIPVAMVTNQIKSFKHVKHIVSIDLHSGQSTGLFDDSFHNLYMLRLFCEFFTVNLFSKEQKENFILIAPDNGSVARTSSYAERLGLPHLIFSKQRDHSRPGTIVKSMLVGTPEDIERARGKTAIVIDDMADTMGTVMGVGEHLKHYGIRDMIVVVSHGLFSNNALAKVNDNDFIRLLITTNSLPQEQNIQKCDKLRVVDTTTYVAVTIDHIYTGKSISELMNVKA